MKKMSGLWFVISTQVITSIIFAFNNESYEKAMIPLFFATLMIILWTLININDKLKPS